MSIRWRVFTQSRGRGGKIVGSQASCVGANDAEDGLSRSVLTECIKFWQIFKICRTGKIRGAVKMSNKCVF